MEPPTGGGADYVARVEEPGARTRIVVPGKSARCSLRDYDPWAATLKAIHALIGSFIGLR